MRQSLSKYSAIIIGIVMVSQTIALPAHAVTWTAWASGNTTVGQTIQIGSTFYPPSRVSGTYIVDTEVYSSWGRVMQRWEPLYIPSWGVTRYYAFDTTAQNAGKFRIDQGVFTTWWSLRSWINDAGYFSLNAAAITTTTTTTLAPQLQSANSNNAAPMNNTASSDGPSATTANSTGADNMSGGTAPASSRTVVSSPTSSNSSSSPTAAPSARTTSAGNPLAAAGLWANPNGPAAKQANAWRSNRPDDARLMDRMAQSATATWFGNWNSDVQADVNNLVSAAAGAGKIPTLVSYNIPNRDCGSYSSGGANGGDAYRSWIRLFAAGIGSRRAAVVLEPDALAQLDCLNGASQAARLSMLSDAVSILSSNANTSVYIDAGHPGWKDVSTMVNRLRGANIGSARGFALNTSNFQTTSANISYGEQIASQLGKHYIVDTSRNGSGASGEWCNPSGRALGVSPTTNTGASHADAFIWIKQPGESDGSCNGGPGAGQWWADYALNLAKAAWS